MLVRLSAAVPVLLLSAGAPAVLTAPINPYDGGLFLTLSRFTSWTLLPYRDLWTLYGPGPAVYGSIIMDLFGRATLPVRLGYLLVQGALVLSVYLLAHRYVGRWLSAILAAPIATIASSEFQFHFAWSVLLLLWGIWFVARSGDEPRHRTRRVAIGTFLIGMSFWGRYEFAPFAAVLVILIWWWLRPSLDRGGRSVLVAGLVPPLLFGVYLVGVVGVERVWLDLVEYPSEYYPRLYCRGLPPVWGPAWQALTAPFHGRLWTTYDTVLALGTFGPPIIGGAVFVTGAMHWRGREARALAMALAGAVSLFVWLELRARAGGAAEPVWAPLMVCLAALTSLVSWARVRAVIVGIPIALIILTIASSWGPSILPKWTRWPQYDPVYGFASLPDTFLFDRDKWDRLYSVVHRYSRPDEPVFVALTDNRGHFANMSVFYWLVDRPPGSRYIGLAPCLTDREPVQREIIDELNDTTVVIQTPYFLAQPPPFAPPSTVLDDYLDRHFEPVYTDTILNADDLVVKVRREVEPATRA